MSEFDDLLERLVPGSGRRAGPDEPPPLPASLGLVAAGVLGRGATGWVVRARDARLDRDVAVKIGRPGHAEALVREARDTARLAHPAVLPVHRLVEDGDLVAIEFRLAPATTLAALLADWSARPASAWPLTQRLGLLLPALRAVAKAHGLGLVHGDLHPGNIAVGEDGEPYVLDWAGPPPADAGFSGSPAYASPAQLRGLAATPADDVYGACAIAWELCALRSFRPRRPDEPTGAYVARWRDAPAPPPPDTPLPGLAAWLTDGLGAERPDAATLADRLADILTGDVEHARRLQLAAGRLGAARAALARFAEGERRLAEERRVAGIQKARVPGWAPLGEKRAVWDAEDRVAAVLEEQVEAWVDATERAVEAAALAPGSEDAHAVLAELWWERLRTAEARNDPAEAAMALRRVRRHDRGRFVAALDAPSHVTLTASVPGATVRVARYDDAAVRVARPVDERPLPLDRHPLPPGSWQLTVRAPGYADAVYPIRLDRLDHHRGRVTLYTEAQIGDGWVYVPGGPFRMGGDPMARNAIEACTPTLGDRFFLRTCVTSAEYLAFLNDLADPGPRLPSEMGLFGRAVPLWRHDGGRVALPDGWDPRWPVMCVSLDDANAYAAWRSAREGRPVRVPTEDEWEKASRGVDGRWWPWGDRFDPTFCRMRESEPHAPRPAPVGAYPTDRSVYGLLDTAGGMREWTTSSYASGQVVVRGGTWGDDADDCRCAGRAGLQPSFRTGWVSFRLVSEQQRPA